MNRRHFLLKTAYSALAFSFVGRVKAQAMDHTRMPGMASMGGMDSKPAQPLAALDVLPAGLPLKPLPILANLSGRDDVFKATLHAAPMQLELIKGKQTTIWAYNQTAAPLLMSLTEGMAVEIELINDLPQPTTLHWHGLPVPPEEDGGPHEAVPPQGRRTYRFTLPEGCAGTYWFHPHPHGVTHEQVFRGLAGVIVVKPKLAKDDALANVSETHLVVTDLKLNADGSIAENDMNDEMNGREGQFLLVNGQYQPKVMLEGASRVRLWNATNARFLNLVQQDSAGKKINLVQVGTDGGLMSEPIRTAELLVSPAERVELLMMSHHNDTFSLHACAYNQGKMGMVKATPAVKLLDIEQKADVFEITPVLRHIEPLGAALAQHKVVLGETMSMASGVHSMKFFINDKQFDMMRMDFTGKKGQVEEWMVENTSDMDHPFHIHGGQFQLIRKEWIDPRRNNVTVYKPMWKDTVNLRSGERVKLKMVQNFTGVRMLHCHILEHEDAGMMANLRVV